MSGNRCIFKKIKSLWLILAFVTFMQAMGPPAFMGHRAHATTGAGLRTAQSVRSFYGRAVISAASQFNNSTKRGIPHPRHHRPRKYFAKIGSEAADVFDIFSSVGGISQLYSRRIALCVGGPCCSQFTSRASLRPSTSHVHGLRAPPLSNSQ
jgi:hypothetical protein